MTALDRSRFKAHLTKLLATNGLRIQSYVRITRAARFTFAGQNEPKPEETSDRLIVAGLALFGSAGLDGVSTRILADTAGVNLAAIPYHFGTKEALYIAVARHIVQTTGANIAEAAEKALAGAGKLSPKAAVSGAVVLLETLVRIILSAPDAAQRGGFILREQLQPTAAFDVLYKGFIGRLHEALTILVSRAIGSPEDDPHAIISAHALLGQALVFGMARHTLLRRLGQSSFTSVDLELILSSVRSLVASALNKPKKGD